MRISSILRDAGIALFTIALALLLSTCGGSRRNSGIPAGKPADTQKLWVAPPIQAVIDTSLDDALAELDAYPCPEGVDPALFAELKDALGEVLNCRVRSRAAPTGDNAKTVDGGAQDPTLQGKFVSTPPTGDENRVTDLAITDNGGGTFTLSWHYRNLGDYDQNGAVGISDITPIAMHYGETYNVEDENCLLAVIDGSGNGEIDIADITPIAMYYATDCAGYRIQRGNSAEGEFASFRIISVEEATGEGRLSFSVGLTSIAYLYLRVVPYDAQGEDGEPSDAVLVPGEPPEIVSVSPTTGMEDEAVQFTAEVNGTGPFSYAWDFGGGAEPDTSSIAQPTVTLGAVGEYEAQLTVTNIFGEDVSPFTLTVNPAPPTILSVSPTVGEEGTSVEFSAEVTGSEPFAYAWDFGGGASPDTSDEASPTVTLGDVGEYSASLTVDNAVSSDTFDFILQVGLLPEITNVSPTGGVSGEEITFNATVTGTLPFTYSWDFAGGATPNTSTEESPTVTLTEPGSYNASVTVENAVGSDTLPFTLTVTWFIVTIDDEAVSGDTSLVIVNGNPAVSYRGCVSEYSLRYVRALDAEGRMWGSPVAVDTTTADVGSYSSLAVVNGRPAISYFDSVNKDLKFIRANDGDGITWGTPTTVDSSGAVGWYTSLAVVQGNPAISYYDATNEDLKYVRASDASGGSWGTPLTLDSAGEVGWYTSLAVVQGNPAISYHDFTNKDLKYVRASDASGESWDTPMTLDSLGWMGWYTSLAVVNGNPAISYQGNAKLKYVRASDASGGSWGTPVTVDSTYNVGYYTSLAVVNGIPAISYFDSANDYLKYVRASDANGESWGTPLTVDSDGDVGYFTSLAMVNDNPAISYGDNTNDDLKFAVCY